MLKIDEITQVELCQNFELNDSTSITNQKVIDMCSQQLKDILIETKEEKVIQKSDVKDYKFKRDALRTLYVSKGNAKEFNYRIVENILKSHNITPDNVYVGRSQFKEPTFGYVTFKTQEDLNTFLQKYCVLVNDAYVFYYQNSGSTPTTNQEFMCFKKYVENSYKKRENIRYINKLHISGLPLKNSQETLHEFFNERRIVYGTLHINNKYDKTAQYVYAKVHIPTDLKSKECINNLELVQELVNESYLNGGIKFKEHKLIVKKFIEKKSIAMMASRRY